MEFSSKKVVLVHLKVTFINLVTVATLYYTWLKRGTVKVKVKNATCENKTQSQEHDPSQE